jgi:hypothetical protein
LDYYLGGRRPGWASKGEDWIIVWGADAQVGRLYGKGKFKEYHGLILIQLKINLLNN